MFMKTQWKVDFEVQQAGLVPAFLCRCNFSTSVSIEKVKHVGSMQESVDILPLSCCLNCKEASGKISPLN